MSSGWALSVPFSHNAPSHADMVPELVIIHLLGVITRWSAQWWASVRRSQGDLTLWATVYTQLKGGVPYQRECVPLRPTICPGQGVFLHRINPGS